MLKMSYYLGGIEYSKRGDEDSYEYYYYCFNDYWQDGMFQIFNGKNKLLLRIELILSLSREVDDYGGLGEVFLAVLENINQ
jgi:hypothetical protein